MTFKRKFTLLVFAFALLGLLFVSASADDYSGTISIGSVSNKCTGVTVTVSWNVYSLNGIRSTNTYYLDGQAMSYAFPSAVSSWTPYAANYSGTVALGEVSVGSHTLGVHNMIAGAGTDEFLCFAYETFTVSEPGADYHTLSSVTAQDPGCTQAGCKAYYHCSGCGKDFSDAAGANEIVLSTWSAEGGDGYIAPLGHDFGDVTYTWENGKCTAKHVCNRTGCTETETETDGTYVKDTDATCTAAETGHYEAFFMNAAFEERQTETGEVGNPLGHSFGDAAYTWEDGQCTAERACTRTGCTETETETDGTYVKDTDATCTEAETGHYEAVFTNDAFTAQKTGTEPVGDPLGHEFGDVTYIWEDGQCTAEHACTRTGCTETETETEGTYVKDTDATCTEAETGHYEAVFTNRDFEEQMTETETFGKPAGHKTGVWKTVRAATVEADGKDEQYCSVCGVLLKTRVVARLTAEEPAAPGVICVDANGDAVELTVTEETAGDEKALVFTPEPEEDFAETDALTVSFSAADLEYLEENGYNALAVKSGRRFMEVRMTVESLRAIFDATGADRYEIVITDRAAIDEETEIELPEGMTQASHAGIVSVLVYKDGEPVDIDPELFEDIEVLLFGVDVRDDMVGLFSETLSEFAELPAEFEEGEEEDDDCWAIPFAGSGNYLAAEKTVE